MAKQLVVISGLERGRSIPLGETDLVQIGCSQHLPIEHRFRDPLVARVHCEIQVQEGRAVLIDAGTIGGTLLNGQRITEEELKQSDIIRIGNTQIRFLCDEATEPERKPKRQQRALLALRAWVCQGTNFWRGWWAEPAHNSRSSWF